MTEAGISKPFGTDNPLESGPGTPERQTPR